MDPSQFGGGGGGGGGPQSAAAAASASSAINFGLSDGNGNLSVLGLSLLVGFMFTGLLLGLVWLVGKK